MAMPNYSSHYSGLDLGLGLGEKLARSSSRVGSLGLTQRRRVAVKKRLFELQVFHLCESCLAWSSSWASPLHLPRAGKREIALLGRSAGLGKNVTGFGSEIQNDGRIQAWTDQAKNTLCGLSCSTLATSLSVCRATQRPATTGSRNDKDDGRQRTNRPDLIEEDIYTIDSGWKVDFPATEEMMEVAGVQIPVRLKQQLQSERRTRRVVEKTPVEPPRATHKLLRAYLPIAILTNSVVDIAVCSVYQTCLGKVMAGRCAGKKLTSPADAKVRPMMEVVRGAVFSILKSLESWNPSSPSGRWLDLYSGTGSVAIEALSRGCCAEAHFVELDPWVISNVLRPNLEDTKCHNQTVIHASKVETLLEQASKRGADVFGGAFDYVSVTPPYEAVSYTELMAQLSVSPLLSDKTFMVVEYPIKSKHEMPDSCGALIKIKDRRYGRTHVAIYGPQWLERDDEVRPRTRRGQMDSI